MGRQGQGKARGLVTAVCLLPLAASESNDGRRFMVRHTASPLRPRQLQLDACNMPIRLGPAENFRRLPREAFCKDSQYMQ